MITVHKYTSKFGNNNFQFSGLSTDSKPTTWGGRDIEVNSMFLELDTGDFYYLGEDGWEKVGSGGGEPEPTGEKLFDGSVTVQYDDDDGIYYYQNDEVKLNYSSLIVEVDGTRYTLSNTGEENYFIFADGDGDIFDGTATFELESQENVDRFTFCTKEDGTYSLKIWANSDPVEPDEPVGPLG